jgi:chorismate--pyruvate lyase
MRDLFWNRFAFGSAEYTSWLRDRGSLTRRIQVRCNHFSVQPLHSGLARIAFDESALLGFPNDRLAFSREVLLCADGHPVVFAHSTCAREHLRGTWLAMNGLGNRSLGTLLFTHPLVKRHALHYKALQPHHALYKRATSKLRFQPDELGNCAASKNEARDARAHSLALPLPNPPPLGEGANESLRDFQVTRLWARRSIFTLHNAPLLVTEVFLPEILNLNA